MPASKVDAQMFDSWQGLGTLKSDENQHILFQGPGHRDQDGRYQGVVSMAMRELKSTWLRRAAGAQPITREEYSLTPACFIPKRGQKFMIFIWNFQICCDQHY